MYVCIGRSRHGHDLVLTLSAGSLLEPPPEWRTLLMIPGPRLLASRPLFEKLLPTSLPVLAVAHKKLLTIPERILQDFVSEEASILKSLRGLRLT